MSPTQQSLEARLQPPGYVDPEGTRYLLGTDQFGRDVLSRLIYGTVEGAGTSEASMALVRSLTEGEEERPAQPS